MVGKDQALLFELLVSGSDCAVAIAGKDAQHIVRDAAIRCKAGDCSQYYTLHLVYIKLFCCIVACAWVVTANQLVSWRLEKVIHHWCLLAVD